MDKDKTKVKLNKLKDSELRTLLALVQEELSNRMRYLSNTENTPQEQCNALKRAFAEAWPHGH
jgi:hypothetical protein